MFLTLNTFAQIRPIGKFIPVAPVTERAAFFIFDLPAVAATAKLNQDAFNVMDKHGRYLQSDDISWISNLDNYQIAILDKTLSNLEDFLSKQYISRDIFDEMVNFVTMSMGKREDFLGEASTQKIIKRFLKYPAAGVEYVEQMKDSRAMGRLVKSIGAAVDSVGYLSKLKTDYLYISPTQSANGDKVNFTPATEMRLLDLFERTELDRILSGRLWRQADVRTALGLSEEEDKLLFLFKQENSDVRYFRVHTVEELLNNIPPELTEAGAVFAYKGNETFFKMEDFFPDGQDRILREDFMRKAGLDDTVSGLLCFQKDGTYQEIMLGKPSRTEKAVYLYKERFNRVQSYYPVRRLSVYAKQIIAAFGKGGKPALRLPVEWDLRLAARFLRRVAKELGPILEERILEKIQAQETGVIIQGRFIRLTRSEGFPTNMSSREEVLHSDMHFHYEVHLQNVNTDEIFQINVSIPVVGGNALLEEVKALPRGVNFFNLLKK